MLSLYTRRIVVGLAAWSHAVEALDGFSVYDSESLDASLGTKCAEALSARFDCLPYVRSFMQLSYRGPLELELTEAICGADCD